MSLKSEQLTQNMKIIYFFISIVVGIIPLEWTCSGGMYDDGIYCHCGCGAFDVDCVKLELPIIGCGVMFEPICQNPTGECEETVFGPDGWICHPNDYNTTNGCHCECGIWDPDCDDPNADVFWCLFDIEPACEGPDGHCIETSNIIVPELWICPLQYYNVNDGCDCNCGAWDPDCDNNETLIYNCYEFVLPICQLPDGQCVETYNNVVPESWTCPLGYYNVSDGCDCNCGTWDPDCSNPESSIYNCQNYVLPACEYPTGVCIETDMSVPPEWQCSPYYYDGLDGCDCNCGAPDPDCDDSTQSVLGCSENEVCSDGICTTLTTVPYNWMCLSLYYNATDGCDCMCGTTDPDCENDPLFTFGCPCYGMTCNNGLGICEGACGDWMVDVQKISDLSVSSAIRRSPFSFGGTEQLENRREDRPGDQRPHAKDYGKENRLDKRDVIDSETRIKTILLYAYPLQDETFRDRCSYWGGGTEEDLICRHYFLELITSSRDQRIVTEFTSHTTSRKRGNEEAVISTNMVSSGQTKGELIYKFDNFGTPLLTDLCSLRSKYNGKYNAVFNSCKHYAVEAAKKLSGNTDVEMSAQLFCFSNRDVSASEIRLMESDGYTFQNIEESKISCVFKPRPRDLITKFGTQYFIRKGEDILDKICP